MEGPSSVQVTSTEIKTPLFRFDVFHFKVEIRDRGLEYVVGNVFFAFDHGALLFKTHVDTRHAGKLCERLGSAPEQCGQCMPSIKITFCMVLLLCSKGNW